MHELLESLSPDQKKKLVLMPEPEWEDPMLAMLTHNYFSDPGWVYDRKLDGARCITYRKGDEIGLMSRTRHEMSVSFPEIREAFAALPPGDYVLDGEIVAFRDDETDFQMLQPRLGVINPDEARATGIPVFYYLFDILYFDGYDVTQLWLTSRKSVLKGMLPYRDPLRFIESRRGDGLAYFKEACGKGWEGLIAKRAESPYQHRRSEDWLKFKCINQQEFVIGGFTDPHGKRIGLGALLLGYYDHGRLRYAGKVGTGFSDMTLKELIIKLKRLEIDISPFDEEVNEKEVHWVRPELVAEIGFENWTREGRLRQPRYRGLRYDKNPKDVVREG
ncbi:MAG TPA: non-homologous end-joining DNA ligase [Methanocella sp.]|jgi:DNA ligase D-like protein (predicted ligase)